MRKKIAARMLIVDDDPDILLTARIVLKSVVQEIESTNDPHQITRLLEQQQFKLVLLDMNFTTGFTSGKEGLRWLRKIRKLAPQTHVILMTAYGDINMAVQAMKDGATDFVVKPWENETLQATVTAALQSEAPQIEVAESDTAKPRGAHNPAAHQGRDAIPIIGRSDAMEKVAKTIGKVAQTDANVLILGENGTGKELAARAVHTQSKRKNGPFVHVDLGAISETLFESELFGHVKGAFTDAREDRAGRFESAQGGTLFLDEIGNLSLPLQAKLLTALQSRQITRVGSNRPMTIDIRLICATNMPLYEMVQEKTFRQDLIYRINTVEIHLPPLRKRMGDVPLLVRHFLGVYAAKYQREGFSISPEIMTQLEAYPWPGNIRELQHALERAVIMEDTENLLPVHSPQAMNEGIPPEQADYNLEEVEKHAIKQAINKHEGNISKAAKELGLGRTTLYRKMNKYGL